MANENCLENIRCPKCGQYERFEIMALVACLVTDDGAEPLGGEYEWDENSITSCIQCGFSAKLKRFQT